MRRSGQALIVIAVFLVLAVNIGILLIVTNGKLVGSARFAQSALDLGAFAGVDQMQTNNALLDGMTVLDPNAANCWARVYLATNMNMLESDLKPANAGFVAPYQSGSAFVSAHPECPFIPAPIDTVGQWVATTQTQLWVVNYDPHSGGCTLYYYDYSQSYGGPTVQASYPNCDVSSFSYNGNGFPSALLQTLKVTASGVFIHSKVTYNYFVPMTSNVYGAADVQQLGQ